MMMLKRTLVACVGLSLFVVAGCAKKKELPARGNLIGTAEFAPELQFQMQQALELDGKLLDLSQNCVQMVERNDGMKVVELSDVKCPANGLADALNVVASMKVYSETEPGEKTYLVMGSSKVLDENTDVAILANTTQADSKRPTFQIESACQKTEHEDLSLNCKIEYNASGAIKKINYKKSRPANLVRRHHIHDLYAADESIRNDMQQMKSTLLAKIESTREALDNKMIAMDSRLQGEDKRIEGKLDTAKTELTAAFEAEKNARAEEDTKLANSLAGLKQTLTNLEASTKEGFKKEGEANVALENKLSAKLTEVGASLTKLSEELKKADTQIGERIDNLKKEIARIEAVEKTSKENVEAINAIKKEIGQLEAMKSKDTMLEKMIGEINEKIGKLQNPEKKAEDNKPAEAELPEAPALPENQ